MKRRRDSADTDATEKELDRILFYHRTQQQLLRTLPARLANQGSPAIGSGGKGKQLSIPTTILEYLPAQPSDYALLPTSAPTSPRNANDPPLRALMQTTSAHFSRTPPSPLNMTYLNGSTTAGSQKPSKNGKAPSTPIPTSQPQPVPSLSRQNRYTRGPIPPFPPGTSPPYRSGSPARPRAVSNASVLNSASPVSSPHNSPHNTPPNSAVPSNIAVFTNSGSPPPPVTKSKPATLSPVQSIRGRSFSKATAPEIIIPEESTK